MKYIRYLSTRLSLSCKKPISNLLRVINSGTIPITHEYTPSFTKL